MALNFNKLVPATPAGATAITFLRDVSGNVIGYITTPASIQATSDLTAQTANIASTTLIPTPAAGMYRITAFIVQTVAATTSGTLPSVVVVFTDGDTSTTQTITLTSTSSANVVGTMAQGSAVFYAGPGADLSFSTTGYASVGGTSLAYAVHVRIESL